MQKCLGVALGLALLAGSAHAATMTFSGGTYLDLDGDLYDDGYVENGITMTGFSIEFDATITQGYAHVDNPEDGHYSDRYRFTMDSRFDMRSVEIWPAGFECYSDVCPGYDNVIITGFRDGAAVAQEVFNMGVTPSLFVASAVFTMLDALEISTPAAPEAYAEGNSHFDIDNLVLLPVPGVKGAGPQVATMPVPPAGLLLLGALGLFAVRRTRR